MDAQIRQNLIQACQILKPLQNQMFRWEFVLKTSELTIKQAKEVEDLNQAVNDEYDKLRGLAQNFDYYKKSYESYKTRLSRQREKQQYLIDTLTVIKRQDPKEALDAAILKTSRYYNSERYRRIESGLFEINKHISEIQKKMAQIKKLKGL